MLRVVSVTDTPKVADESEQAACIRDFIRMHTESGWRLPSVRQNIRGSSEHPTENRIDPIGGGAGQYSITEEEHTRGCEEADRKDEDAKTMKHAPGGDGDIDVADTVCAHPVQVPPATGSNIEADMGGDVAGQDVKCRFGRRGLFWGPLPQPEEKGAKYKSPPPSERMPALPPLPPQPQ